MVLGLFPPAKQSAQEANQAPSGFGNLLNPSPKQLPPPTSEEAMFPSPLLPPPPAASSSEEDAYKLLVLPAIIFGPFL